ncbi:acyltransferase [Flavobacterium sp.]|uniref:acyltransferase family protein n=1 Tax=Flavobacterium sp. TaxID=239 RepID=UPI0025BED251|nr:acyltransferase [Flavobacterium sp.]
MSAQTSQRVFGLDLMRAAAILMVVFGHIGWILPKEFEVVNALLSLSGFLGVEIFFVLSGFLIGRILYREFTQSTFNFRSILNFLGRRWLRTLPNYFFVLSLNIFLVFAVFRYDIDDVWKYFFFLQNFSHAMPAFFPESWSLSIEEFAYLLLPIALFGFSFFSGNRRNVFFFGVFVLYLFFIGTKIYYDQTTEFTTMAQWNVNLKGVVIFRIDAICTGVLAAWASVNFQKTWMKFKLLFALGGCALLLALCFSLAMRITMAKFPYYWNVLFLPLISLAMAFWLPLLSSWRSAKKFVSMPITFISLISYSMYLLHYSVVMQLLHVYILPESDWAITTLFYLSITVVFSYLLYRFFEKPILKFRDSKLKTSEIDFRG